MTVKPRNPNLDVAHLSVLVTNRRTTKGQKSSFMATGFLGLFCLQTHKQVAADLQLQMTEKNMNPEKNNFKQLFF